MNTPDVPAARIMSAERLQTGDTLLGVVTATSPDALTITLFTFPDTIQPGTTFDRDGLKVACKSATGATLHRTFARNDQVLVPAGAGTVSGPDDTDDEGEEPDTYLDRVDGHWYVVQYDRTRPQRHAPDCETCLPAFPLIES